MINSASPTAPVRLHLCCGRLHFREPGWINVDAVALGQDVIADLGQPWAFVAPGSVDLIYCKDGLEHQGSVPFFMAEASRVLKPGGRLEIWVPHYKNPGAYRMTHTHLFSYGYWAAYPEPHDATKDLRVIVNEIVVWRAAWMAPINWIANRIPHVWERLAYTANIHVILEKR
jgi:predicted SAM-dependent methyltransferase